MSEDVKNIDGKFAIAVTVTNHDPLGRVRIINRVSGEEIPDDEPLFLIRARDRLAVHVLNHYADLAAEDGCDSTHIESLRNTIAKFINFSRQHPERMKQPGVTQHIRHGEEATDD